MEAHKRLPTIEWKRYWNNNPPIKPLGHLGFLQAHDEVFMEYEDVEKARTRRIQIHMHVEVESMEVQYNTDTNTRCEWS